MAPARCPVCNDFISIGVTVKLNQGIICPTCLANLRVVSLNPLELEQPDRPLVSAARSASRSNGKRASKEDKTRRISREYGGLDEMDDDYEEYDDYVIERRQRHKTDKDKQRKSDNKF